VAEEVVVEGEEEAEDEGEVCIVIDGEAATCNHNLHKNAVLPRFLTSLRTC
jgi:hypothetical protein